MRNVVQSIVRWEWLILILLMPLVWFPDGQRGFVLLLIPLFWLLRKRVTGRFFPATPDDVAILALVIALLVSLPAVFDIDLSLPKIAGLIMSIALFYAGVQHTRIVTNGRYYLVGSLFLVGSGLAIAGLLASLRNPNFSFLNPALANFPIKWTDLPLIGGLTVNLNELAGMLCWILPLLFVCTLGLWQSRSDWPSRWIGVIQLFLLGMLLFNSFLLLATRSRGGILSVLVAFLVMLAIRFRWGKWFLLFVVIIVSGILLLANFAGWGLFSPADMQLFDEVGLQGRLQIWASALYALREFPITGLGMNGFRELVHIFYPILSRSPAADIGHAHNHLLQAGLDLGILGLVAYLSLWLISAGLLWSAWHNRSDKYDRVLVLGLSGSLTAAWLFGLLDAIALGAKPGFLWWLLLALLVAVWDRVPASGQ